jgi:hypothetical protein
MSRRVAKKHKPENIYKAKRSLWSSPGVDKWREILRSVDPQRTWSRSDSKTIKALCPFHNESNPSFHISLDKGMARCFGCNAFYSDPIKFLADLGGTSYKNALDRIILEFPNVPPILKEEAEEVQAQHQLDVVKNSIYRISKEILNDARDARNSGDQDRIDEFLYAEDTLRWLDLRRIPEDSWSRLSIGIFPTEKHLEQYMTDFIGEPSLVGPAKEYLKKVLKNVQWCGGLLLPFHSTPSQVSRIKIRLPDDNIKNRQGNKNMIFVEEEVENPGYYGLEGCQGMRTDSLTVYVVEGEFDQMSLLLASRGELSEEPSEPQQMYTEMVIATGGSYHESLDDLYQIGFVTVRVISDNPLYEQFNHTKAVISRTKVAFDMKIYVWPAGKMSGVKDPDKAIHSFDTIGPKLFLSSIYDDNNFLDVRQWLQLRIDEDLVEKNKKSDKEFITLKIKEYSKLLTSDEQRDLFIHEMCEVYKVDRLTVTRSLLQNATEDIFIKELEKLILQDFYMVGTKVEGGLPKLVIWSRKNKVEYAVCSSRGKDAAAVLALTVGSVYSWVQGTIGIPDFIKYSAENDFEGEQKEKTLLRKTDDLGFYLAQALQDLSGSVPPFAHLERKKDGVHVLYDAVYGYRVYFSNAGKLYKGTYKEISGDLFSIDWEELTTPTVEKRYIFDFGASLAGVGWTKNTGIADLKAGENVNLKETYDKVVEVITSGWSFENGDLDARLLAAFIMIAPICSVFDRRPAFFVTAEKASGKSKLTIGLMGGAHSGIPRLVEHSVSSVNMTQAAIYQEMDGCPMMFLADEFEADAKSMSEELMQKKIWEVFRSAGDGGYITRGRAGSAEGAKRPVKYHVRFPYILSAIHLVSQSANLSRVIPINMKHESKHVDPGIALANKWPSVFFNDLAKKISVATISHAPVLKDLSARILAKHNVGGSAQKYSSRFVEGMAPLLAFLKYIGEDEEKFLEEFTESKRGYLEDVEHSDTDDLFTNLMTASYRFGSNVNGGDNTQIISILRDEIDIDVLNSSSCGIYFFKEVYYMKDQKDWLLVHWPTVVQGLLRGNSLFKNKDARALKQQAGRSKRAVADELYRNAKAFRKKYKLDSENFDPRHITIYNVSDIVDDKDKKGDDDNEIRDTSSLA